MGVAREMRHCSPVMVGVFSSPVSFASCGPEQATYLLEHQDASSAKLDNKGLSSQGYGFSSGHVWMLELDCEES